VRVFSRDYANPRIYTVNAAFEQELLNDLSLYFDFTHSKGVHLTRFLDYGRTGFFAPFLGETMVASAVGKASYNGFTVGMRKRFSKGYQFEWNYTLAKDKDDDSNERDPFTDRSFNIFNLAWTTLSRIAISATSSISTCSLSCPGGLNSFRAFRAEPPSQPRPGRGRQPIAIRYARTTSFSRSIGGCRGASSLASVTR